MLWFQVPCTVQQEFHLLPEFISFMVVLASSTLGGKSRSSRRGFWGTCCNGSWSTIDGRFSSWLQCSSYFALIPSLPLIMVEPSTDVNWGVGEGGGGCSTSGGAID